MAPFPNGAMGIVLHSLGLADEAIADCPKWVVIHQFGRSVLGRTCPRASDAFARTTFDRFAASVDAVLGPSEWPCPPCLG
jgi:hypothetical protein